MLFAGVSNPNEGVADVPADTYNVKIVPRRRTDRRLRNRSGVPEGTNVIVYAVGDLSVPNFTVAAQTIAGLQAAPTAVPTGTDGVAVDGIPTWLIAAMALGLASVASGRVLATRRNR